MAQKTEYEKMLAGELYDAGDRELLTMRIKAREGTREYNQTPFDKLLREKLLKSLFHKVGKNIDIQTPFFCDY
ncbi:MAG TPA: maltose acetyltransferase domain-containing protein [Chitinophagaceae bacterium]|nr:maltose acetyltransferase domain-containing protein [Chitinophagaceae bacterium]